MELKGRLKLIAEKIPDCTIVCDIGTDHGYIPIYCILKGICKKAIASDVKRGPLLIAQANIDRYGLGKYIETRLGNGLEAVSGDEADVIVIAGMGGILIRDILQKDYEKAKKAFLILQPMNAPEVLRQWLYSEGFEIVDEELAKEGNKFYIVISARWTGNSRQLSEIYYHIGEKLIQKPDPLAGEFIRKRLGQIEKILMELGTNPHENNDVREKYVRMRDGLMNLLEKLE